jgi:AbrB family looped-hinge helix DNA binding protein
MQGEQEVYHLKVDASGRIVLPADARQRNRIAEGDTVIITETLRSFTSRPATRCLLTRRRILPSWRRPASVSPKKS